MDDAERYLEQALSQVRTSLEQHAQPAISGVARYFATCALAVA